MPKDSIKLISITDFQKFQTKNPTNHLANFTYLLDIITEIKYSISNWRKSPIHPSFFFHDYFYSEFKRTNKRISNKQDLFLYLDRNIMISILVVIFSFSIFILFITIFISVFSFEIFETWSNTHITFLDTKTKRK